MKLQGNNNNLLCQHCTFEFSKFRVLNKLPDLTIPYNANWKRIVCPNCESNQTTIIEKGFDIANVPAIGSYSTKNETNRQKR